jgi:LysM repeat protein
MRRLLIITLCGLAFSVSHAQESLKSWRSNIRQTINGKEYYIHTIKKGQTLYMLSKAYEIDVNEIIKANPEVREGIHPGQVIRIPVPGARTVTPPIEKETGKQIPADTAKKLPERLPCREGEPRLKKSYNIALMLPLFLDEAATMDVINGSGDEDTYFRPLQFVEFYEGFRMALDSLEKEGISATVYVYDVVRDTLALKKTLQQDEWKHMDLVIAMVFARSFRIVSDFAKEHEIPVVNPITERNQVIAGNPWVIKVRPGADSQAAELTDYLVDSFPDRNIIVARTASCRDAADRFMDTLEERGLHPQAGDGYTGTVKLLSHDHENVVVIFSDDKVVSLDFVTKLNEIRSDYPLTLIGMPRWDRIDDYFEADYLVNLKAHILCASFVDYSDSTVNRFVRSFQQTYFTDPDPLAFLGYDMAGYFIRGLFKYGDNLINCLTGYRANGLQTEFHFQSTPSNGYENQRWIIYRYGDYRKKKVD